MNTHALRRSLLPLPCVAADATAAEAARCIADSGVGAALVVDGGEPVGIVTVEDVSTAADPPDRAVLDLVTSELVHIIPDADLKATVRTYQDAAYRSAVRRHVGSRTATEPQVS